VKGTARNNFHTGTELSFRFDLDQTSFRLSPKLGSRTLSVDDLPVL
jgi:hypothetical protein